MVNKSKYNGTLAKSGIILIQKYIMNGRKSKFK